MQMCSLLAVPGKLHTLLLCNNNIRDRGGTLLSEAIRSNPNLRRLDLTENPLDYKYCIEIQGHLHRHELIRTQTLVPTYGRQVQELVTYVEQRFTVVDDQVRLHQMGEEARESLGSTTKQKAIVR
jgi:hypothetical protein